MAKRSPNRDEPAREPAAAEPAPAGEVERQLSRSEERFRLLVESVRDYAIFMLDLDGRVQSWNRGAERAKGYRASEILGRPFTCFYTPEDVARGVPQELLRRAAADGRVETEGWRVRKDGTRFWADVVITALRDARGELTGYAKVTRDLSDRVRLEDERLRAARSQEALRLREEFLRVAAHELRTPLTALQVDLETLASLLGAAPDGVARQLERAARSVRRLADVVGKLLDVTRLTGGLELRPERLELTQALRDLVDRLAPEAGCARVRVAAADGGPLEGEWDRERLGQLFTHLLSNAARHAPGAAIEVSLAREQDAAVVTVDDRGPGIAVELVPHLFERFTATTSGRRQGGLGLGLYLAQRIARAHGGSISASNRPGGGARFTVRLPLAAPRPARHPGAAPGG